MARHPRLSHRHALLSFQLYQSRLVPRFISGWGFVAQAMLAMGLAIGVGDPTRGFQPGQVLVIPIILWELVFATWLIVRGFAPSAVAAEVPTKTPQGSTASAAA